MKIALSQAVILSASLIKRIQELLTERSNVSFAKATKGEQYEKPARTFQEITAEIAVIREDLRKLDILKSTANVTNTITWNGEEITILEAIELAKQIRLEASEFKNFGNRKKQDLEQNGWGASASQIVVYALYDTEKARQRGVKLSSVVERLSNEIDKANDRVEIEFAAASKYITTETIVEAYTDDGE